MWREFRDFAMRGNVIDLAVGVIIGGAFGKIITSLVNDVIMPLIGLMIGNINFTNLFIVLGQGSFKTLEEAQKSGAVTINYGLFLNNILNFLIIVFCIFIVIKQINKLTKKKEQPAPIQEKVCKYCYSKIHIDASKCPNCTSSID